MGLRPFFGYYGGKWRDALKNYPPPTYGTIVEPFAGSAGYAVRYADRDVVLCEIDPAIAGVWRYLKAASVDEILGLPDVPDGSSVHDLNVPLEAKWLIGLWLNRASSGPRSSPSKWMRDGIRPGSFWGPRVRQTIASQVDQIRHWTIVEGSYESCADGVEEATWFIDPPYQAAGAHYRHGSSKVDYLALAAWAKTRLGQVIVCEHEGATWLPFRPVASVKTTRKGRRSNELAWIRDTIPDRGQNQLENGAAHRAA